MTTTSATPSHAILSANTTDEHRASHVRSRVPPLLDALIRLPPEAGLILLTGVVENNPSWATLRFLGRFLGERGAGYRSSAEHEEGRGDGPGDEKVHEGEGGQKQTRGDVRVVLVSWLREWEWWKSEARRAVGVDLARLAEQKRFAYVDGLSELFGPPGGATSLGGMGGSGPATTGQNKSGPVRREVPVRSTPRPIPARGPPGGAMPGRSGVLGSNTPAASTSGNAATPARGMGSATSASVATKHTLTSPTLANIFKAISTAITSISSPETATFLILDSPTTLLALNPDITSNDMTRFVLQLRALVHSTLIVTEADAPLIKAAAPDAFSVRSDYLSHTQRHGQHEEDTTRLTPLEENHAAFVIGQAHLSRWVVGLRGLDTGVAKDVSGVISVRRGGAWEEAQPGQEEIGEMEALYRIGMDGAAQVYERGAGDVL